MRECPGPPLASQTASHAPVIDLKPYRFDGPVFASVVEHKPICFESSVVLQQRLDAGSLSSVELATALLQRVEALNHAGPELNALIEVNPDALVTAAQLDMERLAGKRRGPLHGIPIVVKDNLDTADRMQTTSGSPALVGAPAPRDAFVVHQLRQAGAIILGKANLSEWSNFRDLSIPNGWSGRGGQTRNPHDLAADTAGSSAGSAVAIAAGLSPMAVGTETNGSIISPARANGVVGLRPTLGLLSRAGVVPISSVQDTPGPMARTVTDIAILLTAMRGTDPWDKATYRVPVNPMDYAAYLDKDAVQGKRLGYPITTPGGQRLDDDPSFLKIKQRLAQAGAQWVPVNVAPVDRDTEWYLLSVNFRREIDAYLQTRPGLGVATLDDIIAFNANHPGSDGYTQKNLLACVSASLDQAIYFKAANALQQSHRHRIKNVLREKRLDVLVDWSEHAFGSSGAIAGYPGISIPVGLDDRGLPKGLYLLGKAWDEAKLLALAYSLEQLLQKP